MQDDWLTPLHTHAAPLKSEAATRRKPFEEQNVEHALVDTRIAEGWTVARQSKRKTALRRPWPHDQQLENKVWTLFYLLGYPVVSNGRNFKVTIKRNGADPIKKQIDVLAKDDETVVVAECKSSEKISRRSLQKDIEEFASLRGPIANAIRKQFGPEFKPKIIWLFVTNNIVWSQPDRERASGSNIQIITQRELRYYLQIADHLRGAARFQFLAEFLQDQEIPELANKKVPAVQGKLQGKKFYSFVSTPRQMLKLAFVNHRSLNDPDGAPSYQRLVSRTRLRQIKRFIQDGGFFPTNILVNLSSKARFEQVAKDEETGVSFGHLYLPAKYRSAWIIDGQHRLYGYAPLSDEYLDQNIMVVAFEQLAKEEEANLFVTINHEQKSVPKTLLDDLEGELKWGSVVPSERIGAISARLIGLLNEDIGEPLYSRVTRQGIAATEHTCLTVPAIKAALRRSGLVGQTVLKKGEYAPGPLSGRTDTETLDRARSVINEYFEIIRSANPSLWDSGRGGYLCTNVGIDAYLNLLAALTQYMESNKGMAARELDPMELIAEIEEYLDPVVVWLQAATRTQMETEFKVVLGGGGPKEYFFRLVKIVNERFSDFAPEGLSDWEAENSEEMVKRADLKLKELNIWVQKTIFDVFKRVYGQTGDQYWERGVTNKKTKESAYSKSLDDDFDKRLPLENYLDFIQYKEIVESKANWPLFKPVFDIPEPGEKGHAKNLKWMTRINELRRIPAHATEQRNYRAADFDYIEFVHDEFQRRLRNFDMDSVVPGE